MAWPRTNPAKNMSSLPRRSTPVPKRTDTGQIGDPGPRRLGDISTESRPESISKDRSKEMPIATAAPTALSKALWRPRSSRTMIRVPAASKGGSAKAAACAPPVCETRLGPLHRIAQLEDVSPVESSWGFPAGRQTLGKGLDHIRSTETA